MTTTERIFELRQQHRALCEALADLGLPPDVILEDARAGIGQAVDHRSRAGR